MLFLDKLNEVVVVGRRMSDSRWSRVAAADSAVELVMSRRGKPKAKYAGRTFTLDTRNDQRYRWRCDVRQCRSRLTTDLYENHHMVYRFREHDEDQHRRVASERKRRDATYRQQQGARVRRLFLLHGIPTRRLRKGSTRHQRGDHYRRRSQTAEGFTAAAPAGTP